MWLMSQIMIMAADNCSCICLPSKTLKTGFYTFRYECLSNQTLLYDPRGFFLPPYLPPAKRWWPLPRSMALKVVFFPEAPLRQTVRPWFSANVVGAKEKMCARLQLGFFTCLLGHSLTVKIYGLSLAFNVTQHHSCAVPLLLTLLSKILHCRVGLFLTTKVNMQRTCTDLHST